jgi:hypothetical protein
LYKKVLKGVGESDLEFDKAWKVIAKNNGVVARDAWDELDSIQRLMNISQKDPRRVTQTTLINKGGKTVKVSLKSMNGFSLALEELERLINLYEDGEGIAETVIASSVPATKPKSKTTPKPKPRKKTGSKDPPKKRLFPRQQPN